MEMVDLDVSKIFGNHIWPAEWSDGLWDASDQKTIWKNAPEVKRSEEEAEVHLTEQQQQWCMILLHFLRTPGRLFGSFSSQLFYSLAANFFGLLAANFSPHRTCHHCWHLNCQSLTYSHLGRNPNIVQTPLSYQRHSVSSSCGVLKLFSIPLSSATPPF